MTMHAGEVIADVALVRRLLDAQFPRWGELPLSAVQSAGTDNAIFRLGSDMCVRLPRIAYAERQIDKEYACLPKLAPLPLAIPEPMALGAPQDGFPWRWAVYRWIAGETAPAERLRDIRETATTLGKFVRALQACDASGGPAAGEATRGRGLPLSARDGRVRESIDALGDEYDVRVLHATWDKALALPAFAGKPVWIHADLHEGNLLQVDGRLSAVIDFGLAGVGDPASDLTPAWTFLPPEARRPFRDAVKPDEDAWARGRGWALSIAVIALAYYLHTNPTLVRMSRRTIAAVLEDR
jgi:aminoglycoside phosphotransferase (APT) family kinase protein